jgi:hypothetical protein
MCWNGIGTLGCVHDSADQALLPRVVSVGVSVTMSWSQGVREARLPTTRSQPGAGRQHHTSRVSVDGRFHGSICNVPSGGLAGNAFHRAQ